MPLLNLGQQLWVSPKRPGLDEVRSHGGENDDGSTRSTHEGGAETGGVEEATRATDTGAVGTSRRKDFGDNYVAELANVRQVVLALCLRAINRFKKKHGREPDSSDVGLVSDAYIHEEVSVGVGRNTVVGKELFPHTGIMSDRFYRAIVSLWLQEMCGKHECPLMLASIKEPEMGDFWHVPFGETKKWIEKTKARLPRAWVEEEEWDITEVDDGNEGVGDDLAVGTVCLRVDGCRSVFELDSWTDRDLVVVKENLGGGFYTVVSLDLSKEVAGFRYNKYHLRRFSYKFYRRAMRDLQRIVTEEYSTPDHLSKYLALLQAKHLHDMRAKEAALPSRDRFHVYNDTFMYLKNDDKSFSEIDKKYTDRLESASQGVYDFLHKLHELRGEVEQNRKNATKVTMDEHPWKVLCKHNQQWSRCEQCRWERESKDNQMNENPVHEFDDKSIRKQFTLGTFTFDSMDPTIHEIHERVKDLGETEKEIREREPIDAEPKDKNRCAHMIETDADSSGKGLPKMRQCKRKPGHGSVYCTQHEKQHERLQRFHDRADWMSHEINGTKRKREESNKIFEPFDLAVDHWDSLKRWDDVKEFSLILDSDKKESGRKTPSKRRDSIPWTDEEHRVFLLALAKFGKGDWRTIAHHLGMKSFSRTTAQVASHAREYFDWLESKINRKRIKVEDVKFGPSQACKL